MRIHTQEEDFEYRMERVLSALLSDLETSIENMEPDDFDKFIWNNTGELGQKIYESMFEWMSPEDWIKLLKGE